MLFLSIVKMAQDYLKSIREGEETIFVSIHIRRQDYTEAHLRRNGLGLPVQPEFFDRAKQEMEKQLMERDEIDADKVFANFSQNFFMCDF